MSYHQGDNHLLLTNKKVHVTRFFLNLGCFYIRAFCTIKTRQPKCGDAGILLHIITIIYVFRATFLHFTNLKEITRI